MEDCGHQFPVRFFITASAYRLFDLIPSRRHLFGVAHPGAVHLMGTDDFGRDQFSRFLFAGQISLASGLLACTITLALATLFGSLAGYYKGWADDLIMGAAEVSLALPWLYLLLAARAVLPLDEPPRTAFLLIVCILGLIGWARPAQANSRHGAQRGGTRVRPDIEKLRRVGFTRPQNAHFSSGPVCARGTRSASRSALHAGGGRIVFPRTRDKRACGELGNNAGKNPTL